jgi:hypothetical protein
MEAMERCMTQQLHWAAFQVQTEKDNKISLGKLLETPLKRMAIYYLHLQELLQYTGEGNGDFEKLPSVSTRLQEHLEQQKQQKIEEIANLKKGKTSLSKRKIY